MKILNICMGAPFTEGYTYQDNLLSEYQAKHGHNVTVLTSTRTRDSNGKIIVIQPEDRMMNNGVRLIRLKQPNKILQFWGIYLGISVVIKEIAPDFIFVHGLGSFVVQAVVNYKKSHPKVKVVADNHQDKGTTETDYFPFNFQFWIFRLKWHSWINFVAKVYGTTSWRKTFAKNYYGIPDSKLDTLIMGIDSDNLSKNSLEIRKQVRENLEVHQNTFLFITGGKIDKNKHILETMRAFIKIKSNNSSLLIFGAVLNEIKNEFELLLSTDNRIKYIGYLKSHDIQKYFLASDFGLFPGNHSVLWEEAIGCGLPCLFHKYEDNDHTEICKNCIRITSYSEEDIFNIINRVLEEPDLYKKLKQQSHLAASQFSYHIIADKSIEMA